MTINLWSSTLPLTARAWWRIMASQCWRVSSSISDGWRAQHTRTHARTHARAHAHTHARTHTHKHARARTHTGTHACTLNTHCLCVYVCQCACARAYAYKCDTEHNTRDTEYNKCDIKCDTEHKQYTHACSHVCTRAISNIATCAQVRYRT